MFCTLTCLLDSGNSPLAFCAKAHSVQNANTYVQVSGRDSSFISLDLMHLSLFTPWSLSSPIGCQRPSGCSPKAQCYSSISRLRVCGSSSLKHLMLQLRLELPSIPLPLFRKRLLKTILFGSDSTDLDWKHLWISEWLYKKCSITITTRFHANSK